ncbi:MAG: gamma-glutamyl-gamma-aminobutyrate hydrolase family protein [Clostridiales bacterium]|jgi:putative glutamine amidotransferase|nr:gamma-glutamyl-gamma-aminobutyrate hydrolase family protein [Clostridiales bacterium]
MKPVILLVHKYADDVNNFGIGELYQVKSNYARSIINAGGVPLISARGDAATYARVCDGILFTGGCDLEPWRYGEENTASVCNHDLDEMELELFREFYSLNRPMFGICRGIQTINVALGGSLVQDIPTRCPEGIHAKILKKEATPPNHQITSVEGSIIRELFGETFLTNSHHHQSVKVCGEGLRATAAASDGVIEAVEHEDRPIFAVQWHPERMIGEENFDLENMLPLFRRFVDMCRE